MRSSRVLALKVKTFGCFLGENPKRAIARATSTPGLVQGARPVHTCEGVAEVACREGVLQQEANIFFEVGNSFAWEEASDLIKKGAS